MDKITCDGSVYAPTPQLPKYVEKYQFTDHVKEALKSPTFNNWDYDDNELVALIMTIYFELEIPQYFQIEKQTLYNFVNTVRNHYNDNVRYISLIISHFIVSNTDSVFSKWPMPLSMELGLLMR